MFFRAFLSSGLRSAQGGAKMGNFLKVRLASEEVASFGLESGYLGRRVAFMQY